MEYMSPVEEYLYSETSNRVAHETVVQLYKKSAGLQMSEADGVQANYTEECTVIQYFFFVRC